MNRHEAAQFLGKSARSVATYVAEGRLKQSLIKGKTGWEASFETEELERFKQELETPFVPETSLVRQRKPEAALEAIAALAASLRQGLDGHAPKPWLTVAEAAEHSGLPRSYLLAQARAGAVRAVNVGTGKQEYWRFNREALGK